MPSTSFGPVQPFGVRRTIIGQRGRPATPPSRAAAGSRDLVERLVERRREALGAPSSAVVAVDDVTSIGRQP